MFSVTFLSVNFIFYLCFLYQCIIIPYDNISSGKEIQMKRYDSAKEIYASYGVDTEKAIDALKNVTISVHCWQGDDVNGFDNPDALSGGIQTTGNYPGKASTPQELMADIDKAFSLMPGKKKLNLHACYAIMQGEKVDRDKIGPAQFEPWVKFAKERGMGLDFNPTFFSHPMVKDNLTLSSPDEEVRRFWVEHGKRCLEISEYFANETGIPCVMNIWIPDGYKDVPADRLSPRLRFKKSLDEILSIPYDKSKVFVTLESKVFGIGLESYTVGSAEFCLSYACKNNIVPLMDNGHYHPTELVSDKIPALLAFHEHLGLHVTRGVRWDSDHVVLLDDETKEIMKEIVRGNALERIFIATDYFDASINRISAWVTGVRNIQKALLFALLEPSKKMTELQDKADFTALMALSEEVKTLPLGDVWEEYLEREDLKNSYIDDIKEYEERILSLRK